MSNNNIIKRYLWIDLEMTGLDPNEDPILEIAAEVTDTDLKTLGHYEARIKQPKAKVLSRMAKNIWWADYPENRDDFLNNLDDGITIKEVEKEIIAFVEEYFSSEPAILAGNSIYNDRMFIKAQMPEFDLKLHYRMLDVTSFKIVFESKFGVRFDKPNPHRAFDDVQASIAELAYYLKHISGRPS